jgi:hypothetical protein
MAVLGLGFGIAGEVLDVKSPADEVAFAYPSRFFKVADMAQQPAVIDEYGLDTGDMFG